VIAPKAPRSRHGRAEKRKYHPVIRPKRKPTIVPKTHTPPPRVEPKHHGHRDRPHVTPPPRRPKPPVRADKPRPPAHGIHKTPPRATGSRKPPKPPKPGKPIKPPKPPKKKKKKHRR
jgi:putative endonuclease